MEYRLLGPLEVRTGDTPFALGGPKQRALLALLLLNANRVVARDRLVDELWGERPPETAVASVQVYVSRLRKLLPEGALVTRPPGYLLAVEPGMVDLQRFERLVDDARDADPARASGLLREALALWRGPPLAEFGEEPFARVERMRLEELRLAALEQRIEAELALGRHLNLVAELEPLVAEHPDRERLHAQLMLALYRAGRQAQALATYRRMRAALGELGLEPAVALRKLERQILTQDAALDLVPEALAGRVVLPGPLVPVSPFPFVGRVSESAALRVLLERAEGGEGGMVLLAGEAGSGKTRLVRELAREAAGRGVIVCYGASDAAVSVPYQPLREWLEFLLRVCDPDALAACLAGGGEALARLVPELESLTGAPAPPSGDPESDRYLLQGAVAELLRRLSRLQPLLLVADDVHWSDSESLRLLGRVARTAPETRLLIIAAYRDRGEEVAPALSDALADLARLEGVTRLSLGRLSDVEVSSFVRDSVDAEATPELVSALSGLTDGTPLLLCELWRDLLEKEAVEVADGAVRLSRPVAELRGAARIRDVVRQRLLRLDPHTSALLELAAVTGPSFDLRVLADGAPLERGALIGAVEDATRSGMIEELPEPAHACRFTHELVRRAVYDGITSIRRAELHLRVGEALERVHQADPARVLPELAHHFTLAASVAGVERGVEYNLLAADAAIAASAYDEAAARFSSALELGIADPPERARVQVELAYLFAFDKRDSEAEALLAASREVGAVLPERGVEALMLLHRLGHRRMGDPEADPALSRTVAEQAIETLTALGDVRGLAVAGRWFAIALRRQGRLAECCAAAERALVHADASGDRNMHRQLVGTLAFALCDGPAPVGDAIHRCEQLLQPNGGDREARLLEATITRFLSVLHAMAARFDEAREHLRRSDLLLHELGLSDLGPKIYRSVVADANELAGDRGGAEQELTAMWQFFCETHWDPDALAMQASYELALLYCDAGRWDEAERCLAYGREVPVPAFFRHEAVVGLAARARLAAHRGELAAAVTLAQHAVELAELSDMLNVIACSWLALAEAQRANGQTAAAEAAVARALGLYEQKGNVAAAAGVRTRAVST